MDKLLLNIYNVKTNEFMINISTEEFLNNSCIEIPFIRTLIGTGKLNGNYEFIFEGLVDFKLEISGSTFDKLIENLFNDYTKINPFDFRLLYVYRLINLEKSDENKSNLDYMMNKNITNNFEYINNVCNSGLILNKEIINSTFKYGLPKRVTHPWRFLNPYKLREYDTNDDDKKLEEFYKYIERYNENIVPHYVDDGFIECYVNSNEKEIHKFNDNGFITSSPDYNENKTNKLNL